MGASGSNNRFRHVRVLLFQARHRDDPTGTHELECFVDKTGLSREQVATHDLLGGPPTLDEVFDASAVMIGGSGDFYVSRRDLPHFADTLALLRTLVDRGHPLFGSCFGYQCLVEALGGEIVHDPAATEVGTFELTLTDDGVDDPLFNDLPARFNAQMGHKDRATRHPDGIPNLASSPRSPFQALRIPGKPIWATQFHPELCHVTNRERYEHYRQGYAEEVLNDLDAHPQTEFDVSDEASELLRRFLELVL